MRAFYILQKLRRCDSGASMLEFALVAPVLAFLLVGMVDFGRGMAISMQLESAARSGAEYGSLFPQDTAGLQTAVTDALGSGLSLAPNSVSAVAECRCAGAAIDCSATCNGGGAEIYLAVRVNHNYSPLLPYPGIAANYPLSGTAEFRVR